MAFIPNSSRFLENFVNINHKVLGITLEPFCLLHLLFLNQIRSPFVDAEAQGGNLEDLEKAVLVCSSKSFDEITQKLAGRHGGVLNRFKWLFWRKWNRRFGLDLNSEVLKLLSYCSDYTSMPIFADGKGGASPFSAEMLYIGALIKETGWDLDSVLAMPLGQVVWINSILGFLKSGETNIISDNEERIRLLLTGEL